MQIVLAMESSFVSVSGREVAVERVVQSIAHQVEREHGDQDRRPGNRGQVPLGAQHLASRPDHRGPAHHVGSPAEEAEGRLREDGSRQSSTPSGALRRRFRYELVPLLDEYLRQGLVGSAASELQAVRDTISDIVTA
jgi:hypothetical protein